MKPIWIFRHVAHEGPGYLGTYLEARSIPYRVIAVDQGEPVPATPAGAAGLVFMGGPMSVNDDLPWVRPEIELIRRARDADLPVLGHCLGGQLMARALGATVGPGPAPEIGWFPVARAGGEAAERWLGDLPERFEVFHWHGERFELPAGAEPLLTGDLTPHQAFVQGPLLALQCHVEMTPDMVGDWVRRNAAELVPATPSVQRPEAMARELEARCRRLRDVADVLYGRWLEGVASG
jgi:GMP synthase-like glutamine amidotransferase